MAPAHVHRYNVPTTPKSFIVFFYLWIALCDFQEGEFVPTARRGQFHASRTAWHDLLGRHCPRFGLKSLVAIPIPQPKGYLTVENGYKIQFSFAGDQHITPWLKIMGKGAPSAPLIKVRLVHTGPALVRVKAEVEGVPMEYLVAHHQLLREFNNASYWPKHVLVEYTWEHSLLVNAVGGLYLLFATGLLTLIVMAGSVILTYEQKLKAFLEDITAEDPLPSGPMGLVKDD